MYKAIQFAFIAVVAALLGSNFHPLCFLGLILVWLAFQINYKVHAIIVVFLFFLFNAAGIIEYNFLPQAQKFVDQELGEVLLTDDFHVLRFLVSYPAVLMSDFLNIDLDKAFTFYGTFFIVGSLLICLSWIDKLSPNRRRVALLRFYMFIFPIFILVSFVINGRIAAPYFGAVLILFLQVEAISSGEITLPYIIGQIFSIFLATVSSGTFLIMFAQAIIGNMILFMSCCKWKTRAKISVFLLTLLAISFNHFWEAIERNLLYFNGSILEMLRHGAGKFINTVDSAMLALMLIPGLIVTIILFIGIVIVYRHCPAIAPIFTLIGLGMAGGLFGFLTGTMALPGLLILILLKGFYLDKSARIKQQ